MIRLNEKDRELLKTGTTIKLSGDDPVAKNFAYMGGEFRTNEEDYLEVLIYDTNENFLESAVADRQDYYKRGADHESTPNMIIIRTGTILRKMGYDRGTYIVKYNFLRNIAGSYETVLVDKNDVIWPGNFHQFRGGIKSGLDPNDPAVSEGRLDLFLKDFKYYIHEISPSRTEIRLAPQKIIDRGANKYYRNFYLSARTRETVIGMGNEDARVEFVGNDKASSKTLRLTAENARFLPKMVGGTFSIPNAYIANYTTIPQAQAPTNFQVIEEREGDMRARFYLDREASFTEISSYMSNTIGDQFFGNLIQSFENNGEGFSPSDSINSVPSAQFVASGFNSTPRVGSNGWAEFAGGSGNTLLKDLYKYNNGNGGLAIPTFRFRENINNTIVIRSNSILPNLDIPTTYTWELTGWDKGNPGDSSTLEPIYPKEGDNDGDFILIGPDSQDPTVATPRGDLNVFQATTQDSTDGSTLVFQLASKDVAIGIKLTVEQALGEGVNATSTLWLPACIYQTE